MEELSTRAANSLVYAVREGRIPALTLSVVRGTSTQQLLRIPNFGRVCLEEVRKAVGGTFDEEHSPQHFQAFKDLTSRVDAIAKRVDAMAVDMIDIASRLRGQDAA
jgi:hypothetical protein